MNLTSLLGKVTSEKGFQVGLPVIWATAVSSGLSNEKALLCPVSGLISGQRLSM